MRSSVCAIIVAVVALVAFRSGMWWAHHSDDGAPASHASDSTAPQPEVSGRNQSAIAAQSATNASASPVPSSAAKRTRQEPEQRDLVVTTAPPTAMNPHIDVSPGFEQTLAPASHVAEDKDNPAGIPVRRHLKLQAEARDENWSSRVESDIRAQIRSELMAQGADPHRIELAVVECRTSGCEVQAIGYPEDNLKGADLQRILPKIMRGAMAADFDPNGLMVMLTSRPDDRLGYIAFLTRKN